MKVEEFEVYEGGSKALTLQVSKKCCAQKEPNRDQDALRKFKCNNQQYLGRSPVLERDLVFFQELLSSCLSYF